MPGGTCAEGPAPKVPELSRLTVEPGIEIRDQLFLITPIYPCSAQLALPYMARVTGRVTNRGEDAMIKVEVILLDAAGETVGRYSELLALDAGEKGEFDVKVIELKEGVKRYSIAIEKIDESDLAT